MSIFFQLLLPCNTRFKNPLGGVHPFIANRTLKLAVWTISESNYKSSWRMWASWCDKKEVDAFRCDVIKILDYLGFLFEKDYEYRFIGCHRSATSAYHDNVDGKSVGQHPEVCALVSKIFNNKPTQPRYAFVWSVESVISYIKTKWKNNENLSVKNLTYALSRCKVYGYIRGCLHRHFSKVA